MSDEKPPTDQPSAASPPDCPPENETGHVLPEAPVENAQHNQDEACAHEDAPDQEGATEEDPEPEPGSEAETAPHEDPAGDSPEKDSAAKPVGAGENNAAVPVAREPQAKPSKPPTTTLAAPASSGPARQFRRPRKPSAQAAPRAPVVVVSSSASSPAASKPSGAAQGAKPLLPVATSPGPLDTLKPTTTHASPQPSVAKPEPSNRSAPAPPVDSAASAPLSANAATAAAPSPRPASLAENARKPFSSDPEESVPPGSQQQEPPASSSAVVVASSPGKKRPCPDTESDAREEEAPAKRGPAARPAKSSTLFGNVLETILGGALRGYTESKYLHLVAWAKPIIPPVLLSAVLAKTLPPDTRNLYAIAAALLVAGIVLAFHVRKCIKNQVTLTSELTDTHLAWCLWAFLGVFGAMYVFWVNPKLDFKQSFLSWWYGEPKKKKSLAASPEKVATAAAVAATTKTSPTVETVPSTIPPPPPPQPSSSSFTAKRQPRRAPVDMDEWSLRDAAL